MRTISIANQKGGCGKTTTAINLSSALTFLSKKVLLIDLDPQSHASFGLGVSSQSTDRAVYNILTDHADKRRSIGECIVPVSQGLSVIPSNILLSTLEQELKEKEDAVSRLHDSILSMDKSAYDFIIIDCPPSLGFLTFNALRAADFILVPIDMSAFSLMGVAKLLGMLELIKVKINHAPRVSGLATIFDKRTKYSQTMLDEIRAFFKDQMLETVIRTNVTLKKAASKGVSVIQYDKESNGAIDYTALAQEVLRVEGAMDFEKALASVPETTQSADAVVLSRPRLDAQLEKEVVFSVSAPNAKEIYLAGDFNDWKLTDDCRLSKDADGRWEKRVGLSPGRYRYKFVIDGEWVIDSQNVEREQNPFGTFDSVMKLEEGV